MPTAVQFTRREWLMLIALLLITEYVIFSFSQQHESEQSFLNYISFAATISSILLAVIAIIYGFYQSYFQQQGASQMLAQIDNLRSVASDLLKAPSEFKGQLDRIGDIVGKLDALESNLVKSNERLGTIQDAVTRVQNDFKRFGYKQPTDTPATTYATQEMATLVLNRTTFDADVIGYALNRYVTVEKTNVFSYERMIDKYFRPALSAPKEPKNFLVFLGQLSLTISALRALGLVTGSAGEMVMSDVLKSALPAIAKNARSTSEQWVLSVLDCLDTVGA